jgi:hypothetical protein
VRVNGALIAVSHDQTFLEAIGVERGDHSLTKHSAVKVSFGSKTVQTPLKWDVCFTPESRHRSATLPIDLLRCSKGHSVIVMRRGGEVDTIFGFEKEADALQWIKEKSQAWLVEQTRTKRVE